MPVLAFYKIMCVVFVLFRGFTKFITCLGRVFVSALNQQKEDEIGRRMAERHDRAASELM